MAETNELNQTREADRSGVIARFEFEESRYPLFLSVSSLFYDLELAHDLAVLLSYPEYDGYRFGPRFWIRAGRRVEPVHRLRTSAIVKQSPLVLELVIGAAGAIWGLVQIIDKVRNWDLNRKKLELEVGRLIQDHALKEAEILEVQRRLERSIRERRTMDISPRLVERLSASEIRLIDLDLRSSKR
jgi:hypothetical protein